MVRHLTCPICNKALKALVVDGPSCFPFCSERCRNVDLLRWCKGEYAIVEPLSDDAERRLPSNDAELEKYLEDEGL